MEYGEDACSRVNLVGNVRGHTSRSLYRKCHYTFVFTNVFPLGRHKEVKGLDTQGDKGKERTRFSFSRWFLSTKGTSLCLFLLNQ